LIDGLWAAHARELLGDLAGAEQDHVAKWESLREGRGHLPDARAMLAAGELAHLLCSEGRWDEAEALLVYGSDVPEPSFYRKEAVVRLAVRGRIALHRGDLEGATDLAVRAVELGEQTDLLNWRGRLWETAAEAHRAAGDGGGAEDATLAATRLYTAKGNVAAVSALAT
jgi:hypothetical protein